MSEPETRAARTGRSAWNWLLLIPVVLPVLTPLFNHDSPRLWGLPEFYWLQLSFVIVGVVVMVAVYQLTKKR